MSHMQRLSDESLLAGFGSKDPELTAAFVRRFQGRVFGLALTIVKDAVAAEEIAQEAFVRSWQHADAYDPRKGRVDTWLLTITRNLSIDMRRARAREVSDGDETVFLQLVSSEGDPEASGLLADETRQLHEAIAERLSEEQRRVLLLAAFGGLSGREISETEGIPVGTVKTRLRAAMLRLRAAFEVSRDD